MNKNDQLIKDLKQKKIYRNIDFDCYDILDYSISSIGANDYSVVFNTRYSRYVLRLCRAISIECE